MRRPQHQRAAPRAEPAQAVAGAGHRGRVLRDRQQGIQLHPAHGRQGRVAGHQSTVITLRSSA